MDITETGGYALMDYVVVSSSNGDTFEATLTLNDEPVMRVARTGAGDAHLPLLAGGDFDAVFGAFNAYVAEWSWTDDERRALFSDAEELGTYLASARPQSV